MKERAVQFGPQNRLVGILTEPDAALRHADAPAVILLTAGFLHRAGPFRLHVELARELAQDGIVCLRLDQSGRGDSDISRESGSPMPDAVQDIQHAIDCLEEQTGVKRVILSGLCSGARDGHDTAVQDPRVVGVAMIDGYAYRTIGYHLWRCLRPLVQPSWACCLAHRVWKRLSDTRVSTAPHQAETFSFLLDEIPPSQQIRQELTGLVDRDVRLLFVFTGGIADSFNHRAQLRAMFGPIAADPRVELYTPFHADHTFSWVADRDRFRERFRNWVKQQFVLSDSNGV